MEDLTPLFQFLYKFVDLSYDEFQQIVVPLIEVRKFDKKEFATKAGEVENYMNFILQGLAYEYYTNDGEEVILQVAVEGQFLYAQDSFHSRKPSEYFIETLEPTVFASISFLNLEKLYAHGSKMERLGRLIITFNMIQLNTRQMRSIKLPPRERFLQFIKNNNNLFLRVPQKILASYLNIQPETFSRFKHLLRERKK